MTTGSVSIIRSTVTRYAANRNLMMINLCAIVVGVATCAKCHAQDLQRYQPNVPVPGQVHRCRLPVLSVNSADGSTEVCVNQLRGVMILADETRL